MEWCFALGVTYLVSLCFKPCHYITSAGMDWDELEAEAAREDRKHDASDEEEAPRKRKGGGGGVAPAKRRR